MKVQFHIRTYDSIPTDLAAEMRAWPEFITGENYTVHLQDLENGNEISVWMTDPSDDFPTVIVEGPSRSQLLDKTLGRAIQALSEHNDNLTIDLRRNI